MQIIMENVTSLLTRKNDCSVKTWNSFDKSTFEHTGKAILLIPVVQGNIDRSVFGNQKRLFFLVNASCYRRLCEEVSQQEGHRVTWGPDAETEGHSYSGHYINGHSFRIITVTKDIRSFRLKLSARHSNNNFDETCPR